jgi:hypothetical protein
VCSHTMAMERVLENMVEFGVTAAWWRVISK